MADSTPQNPSSAAADDHPAAGVEELSILLDLQRRLFAAPEPKEFSRQLGRALEGLLSWTAYVLLQGVETGVPVVIQGGRRLGPAARRQFVAEVGEAARRAGLPPPVLTWAEDVVDGAEEGAGEMLAAPFVAGQGSQKGLLLVLPVAGAPVPRRVPRLLAGVAQQAGIWWTRWQHGEVQRRAQMDAVLATVPCGVLLVDDDDRILTRNTTAISILSGLTGGDGMAAGTMDDFGLPLHALPESCDIEFSCLCDQRRYTLRWAELTPGAGQRAVLLTDVSAERGAREQVMQAEKMSVLGEMLSGVAHELNNPLASVVGFSQLLRQQVQDEGVAQRLNLIADEAQRAKRIVANLLDVARARPAEQVPISLDEVVHGILELFAYGFRVDNIEAQWHADADLPPIMGDRGRVQQVLVNLVSNAHHAMRRSASPRRLSLSADQVDGRVRLQVSDTGGGIPESHLDRIFAPFFTTKDNGAGTGLGLAICARIMEEHGGGIHVRSKVGQGATFVLDLPAASTPVEAAQEEAPSAAAGREGGRLLVVEDEEVFRLLLQEALTDEGLEVDTAADGIAALEMLAENHYDAVVSDVRMPRMTGMDMYGEACRRWPRLCGRFVFITGDVMDADVNAFMQSTGVPHLPKPFGLLELSAALRCILATDNPPVVAVLDSQSGETSETET